MGADAFIRMITARARDLCEISSATSSAPFVGDFFVWLGGRSYHEVIEPGSSSFGICETGYKNLI
jgi:hypothetical protein